MSSLFDLLTQKQPQFQTHQALVVVGLQNDFISPTGKLPVSNSDGLIDRVKKLVPVFRDNAGEVIWVRTEFDPKKPVEEADDADAVVANFPTEDEATSDDGDSAELSAKDLPSADLSHQGRQAASRQRRARDLLKRIPLRKHKEGHKPPHTADKEDELFLTKSAALHICLKDSPGAAWADNITASIDKSDIVITKSRYSAFKGNSLLLTLRAKLITELYVCGCISNISVFATAAEAARHGFSIYLIDDCLGFRKLERHTEALRQMVELFGAHTATSAELIKQLAEPSERNSGSAIEGAEVNEGLKDMLKDLKIRQNGEPSRSSSSTSGHKKSTPSTTSANAPASRTGPPLAAGGPLDARDDDDNELDEELPNLERHLSSRSTRSMRVETPEANRNGSIKSKIRMRRRPESAKKSTSGDSASTKTKEADKAAPGSSKEQSSKAVTTNSAAARSNPSLNSKAPITHTTLPKPSAVEGHKASSASTPASQAPKEPQPSPSPRATHKKIPSLATLPTLGPEDKIGSGDSRIVHDFLPQRLRSPTNPSEPLSNSVFQKLYTEVHWQKMLHAAGEVPRLVCVQGAFGPDGSMPVYRHPSDQSLPLLRFSPTVEIIRKRVEDVVGHSVNHVLIQLYRDGKDYISEHSDKTLDIVRGSSIVNVSFGAQRTMRLRTKRDVKAKSKEGEGEERQTQRVSMPHNSVFVLGQETNMRWLHGINADKRREEERSAEERDFRGMRISLTFRHIGTFLSGDEKKIWGQGASAKEKADAKVVINGNEKKTEELIKTFGQENQSTEFDWDETYGKGFDVLHFRDAPKDQPIVFTSNIGVESQMVLLYLKELDIDYTLVEAPEGDKIWNVEHEQVEVPEQSTRYWKAHERGRQICFRDTDTKHTEVHGATVILAYLERYHSSRRNRSTPDITAQANKNNNNTDETEPEQEDRETTVSVYTYLFHTETLLRQWSAYRLYSSLHLTNQASQADALPLTPHTPPAAFMQALSVLNELVAAGQPQYHERQERKQEQQGKQGKQKQQQAQKGKDTNNNSNDKKGDSNNDNDNMFLLNATSPSVADCALWPLLDDIEKQWKGFAEEENWVALKEYSGRVRGRLGVAKD